MDPTTMMSQMVEFDQLQEVTNIDQLLQTALGSATSATSPSTQAAQPTGGN
jgi:flagellar hook assembly protein FlgD